MPSTNLITKWFKLWCSRKQNEIEEEMSNWCHIFSSKANQKCNQKLSYQIRYDENWWEMPTISGAISVFVGCLFHNIIPSRNDMKLIGECFVRIVHLHHWQFITPFTSIDKCYRQQQNTSMLFPYGNFCFLCVFF